MLCQWSVLFRLCCLNNQLNWHDELLAVLCELQRHEFVSQCCLSSLRFSVVCRCLCRLLTAYSLCWPSHSQSAQRDGHALACCCGICCPGSPGSQPAEGQTDSLDTMPFQFEYGLSSFAKLMCQADFSCPGENLLVGPCFSLDMANISMLRVVGDHLLAVYTSIVWAGRRVRFSGNRPGLDRKSNETRSKI